MKLQHGAYILGRYSTDNQNPDSIEVQVEKCSEWCKNHNMPILDIFADYAVSGMKDTRPEYERMIRQLNGGGADTVVIYDQSRMFRKLTAWFSFREQMEAMGVQVVSVTQPMIGGDMRDPTTFLTEGSMALFNQIWALQTRQKVIEKMRFMANNRQHTGGVPALGYCVVDGRLEICEAEAAVVREIFHDYANGMSYREIIQKLNAAGRRTKAGNAFGKNSLHDLLKNEKYIGVLKYGAVPRSSGGRRNSHGQEPDDVIRIEDGCPRIIDNGTWEDVQRKMATNKREKSGRPPVRDYPLKRKVFCGECGSVLTAARSKNKYYYYGCENKKRTFKCDLPNIGVKYLEDTVADAVRNILCRPENVKGLIEIMRSERDRVMGGAGEKLKTLVAEREQIQKKLDAAADAILSGLNSDTLRKKIENLETEKNLYDCRIAKLKTDVDAVAMSDSGMQDGLSALLERAKKDNSAILAAVARVEVSADTIKIWTLLDSDFSGDIDYTETGAVLHIDGARLPAPPIIVTASFIVICVKR